MSIGTHVRFIRFIQYLTTVLILYIRFYFQNDFYIIEVKNSTRSVHLETMILFGVIYIIYEPK